jgi:hypothetical protein
MSIHRIDLSPNITAAFYGSSTGVGSGDVTLSDFHGADREDVGPATLAVHIEGEGENRLKPAKAYVASDGKSISVEVHISQRQEVEFWFTEDNLVRMIATLEHALGYLQGDRDGCTGFEDDDEFYAFLNTLDT